MTKVSQIYMSEYIKAKTFKKKWVFLTYNGLPWWLSGKESICNAGNIGDMGSTLGLGRSPGGGYGSWLQYSCLENHMDRRASGLQSMGSQRVRYNWVTFTHTHTHTLPKNWFNLAKVRGPGSLILSTWGIWAHWGTSWIFLSLPRTWFAYLWNEAVGLNDASDSSISDIPCLYFAAANWQEIQIQALK